MGKSASEAQGSQDDQGRADSTRPQDGLGSLGEEGGKVKNLYVLEDYYLGKWYPSFHLARWSRDEARKLRREHLDNSSDSTQKVRIAIYKRTGVTR